MENDQACTPFARAPHSRDIYGSSAYNEALARLRLMVEHRYFGVLTGEVGSGKSTLIRHLAQTLDPMRYHGGLPEPGRDEAEGFLRDTAAPPG